MEEENTNIEPDDLAWDEIESAQVQPEDPEEETPFGDNDEDFGVIVEPDLELEAWQHERIIITTMTYRKFMALDDGTGLWTDAYLLYNHFYFTARTQETNQIWANRTYCKKGLHWGQEKYKKAFGFLLKYGFIEQVRREKAEKGQFPKVYIKVNYLSNSTVDPDRSKVKEVTVDPKPIDPDRSAKCFKDTSNNVRRDSNESKVKPPVDSPIVRRIKDICMRLKIPNSERDQWLRLQDHTVLLEKLAYAEDYQTKHTMKKDIVCFIQSSLSYDYDTKGKQGSGNMDLTDPGGVEKHRAENARRRREIEEDKKERDRQLNNPEHMEEVHELVAGVGSK